MPKEQVVIRANLVQTLADILHRELHHAVRDGYYYLQAQRALDSRGEQLFQASAVCIAHQMKKGRALSHGPFA